MGSPELQASRRECPPFAARSKIAPGNTPVAGNHNIDVAVATQNIMINILTLDWIMFTIVFGAAEKNTRVKSLVVDWIVLTFLYAAAR